MAIPTIETARLQLKAMRLDDFDRFAEIWASPDVVRYIGEPRSRSVAWQSFLRNAGHWDMLGIGQWAIVETSSQRMIGQTGFFFVQRELGADFDECPEAGWVLSPEAQGKGFGPEAVAAAHDWYDRNRAGPLVAVMTEDNTASRKLADGVGYELYRRAELSGEPVILMKRQAQVVPG